MKELTALEAKTLADSNKIVAKMVRKILRKVYKTAKKGGYNLKYDSPYGEVIDKRICERLRGLGYRAWTSIIAADILVYWDKTREE